MKKSIRILLAMAALLSAQGALAQSDEAALTGSVQDASGAKIVGALVSAVNAGTNTTRTTQTTGAGSFYMGNLPIGVYNVSISAPDFSSEQLLNIELSVGQERTADVRLNVGKVSQDVRFQASSRINKLRICRSMAVISRVFWRWCPVPLIVGEPASPVFGLPAAAMTTLTFEWMALIQRASHIRG